MTFLKDNSILYDYLTGYDHLNFLANVHKIDHKKIKDVVDLFGIDSYIKKKTSEYSLGMKQHLILAMNVLVNPKLIILDEPLNGLNPTSVIKIRKILKNLAKNKATILLSSHTLSEIDLLTENIFFLKNGRIECDDFFVDSKFKYVFLIDKLSLEQIYKNIYLLTKDYKSVVFNQDALELIFTSDEKNVFSFIEDLLRLNIKFKDVKKLNIGSESRYMKMYPEEINKIRNLLEN